MVLSSISVVSSTNSCSIRAERICSHTPAFVHARNRLHTLCHGPNRSGRSRHGTPVFSQYGIALSISRLLFPGRPPCGFLSGGNWLLILFHCFSLISCRFMNSILLFLHFVHNTKVLKQSLVLDVLRLLNIEARYLLQKSRLLESLTVKHCEKLIQKAGDFLRLQTNRQADRACAAR